MQNTSLVQCPACKGTGKRMEIVKWNRNNIEADEVAERDCRCCYGTGEVVSQRVCPKCKRFASVCPCHKSEWTAADRLLQRLP